MNIRIIFRFPQTHRAIALPNPAKTNPAKICPIQGNRGNKFAANLRKVKFHGKHSAIGRLLNNAANKDKIRSNLRTFAESFLGYLLTNKNGRMNVAEALQPIHSIPGRKGFSAAQKENQPPPTDKSFCQCGKTRRLQARFSSC